jgi:hypothetical protein
MLVLIQKLLIVSGSMIFLVLGTLHLYYTFFSEKFLPRNPVATSEMKKTSLRMTKTTTVWNAWIGFNASHSSGAIYFGLVNLFLVFSSFDLLQSSVAWPLLNTLTALFYLYLSKKYWFKVPFLGMLTASICFFASLMLTVALA